MKGGCGNVAGRPWPPAGAADVSEKSRRTRSIALMVVDGHRERFSFGIETIIGRVI